MTNQPTKRAGAEICYRFSECGIELVPLDVVEEIKQWVVHGDMEISEAQRMVATIYRHKFGVTQQQYNSASMPPPDSIPIDDISASTLVVSVTGTVESVSDVPGNDISSVGVISDDSGEIKFTSFTDISVTENVDYTIEKASISEFDGGVELVINSASNISVAGESDTHSSATIQTNNPPVSVFGDGGETTTPTVTETNTEYAIPYSTERQITTVGGTVVNVGGTNDIAYQCSVANCDLLLNDGECPDHGLIDSDERVERIAVAIDIETDDGLTTTVTIPPEIVETIANKPERDLLSQTGGERSAAETAIEDEILTHWVKAHHTESMMVVGLTINPKVDQNFINDVTDGFGDE